MNSVWFPALLGAAIVVMGLINWKGNLSTLHWYHRHRVTEENRPVFGKLVGAGTMLIGVSLVAFSVLSAIGESTQNAAWSLAGSVLVVLAAITGIAVSFYAMIKYNKGIF